MTRILNYTVSFKFVQSPVRIQNPVQEKLTVFPQTSDIGRVTWPDAIQKVLLGIILNDYY